LQHGTTAKLVKAGMIGTLPARLGRMCRLIKSIDVERLQ
jgi:hypothetical protein